MKVLYRIKANKDFGTTIKNGQTIKNSAFVIHYLKTNIDHVRVGLSVSTKLGNAVIRNRIKRQIRAMCDSSINYTSHTFDIVIIAKQQFLDGDYNKNLQLLNNLLSQIGIKE